MQSIMGGRLAAELDATGTPKPGALRGFVKFIVPAALAARGPDIYVADMGARKLYRFDRMQQALSIVPGVTATPRMRLQLAADLTLYVLDPDHATLRHYARDGRLMQTLPDARVAMHLTEFVLDEAQGRIVAGDQLNQRLLQLPLAGRIISVFPGEEVGAFSALGALSRVGEEIYVLDSACVCIVRVDAQGQVQQRFGYGALAQPHAMVADRFGRLFVADGFDRTLKVFHSGALMARYEPAQLNLAGISALALDEGLLYVSDGPGARVAVFRVQPPARVGDAQPH
jgi:hypothetical protein